jgi:hypothetical protein
MFRNHRDVTGRVRPEGESDRAEGSKGWRSVNGANARRLLDTYVATQTVIVPTAGTLESCDTLTQVEILKKGL